MIAGAACNHASLHAAFCLVCWDEHQINGLVPVQGLGTASSAGWRMRQMPCVLKRHSSAASLAAARIRSCGLNMIVSSVMQQRSKAAAHSHAAAAAARAMVHPFQWWHHSHFLPIHDPPKRCGASHCMQWLGRPGRRRGAAGRGAATGRRTARLAAAAVLSLRSPRRRRHHRCGTLSGAPDDGGLLLRRPAVLGRVLLQVCTQATESEQS